MFIKFIVAVFCLHYITVDAQELKKYTNCTQAPANICGPNSRCYDASNSVTYQLYGEPFCRCLPNFIGKPPSCKSVCSPECKSDEYCDVAKKVCKKGCESSDVCKQNEICDRNTRKCTAGCNGDSKCKADEFCEYTSRTCKKGCRGSTSCKDDEYCDFGSRQCKKGCRRAPNNCKAKQYCNDKRVCQDGCASHADCNSNEVCRTDHKCVDKCVKSRCGDNSDCSIVDHKYYCTCKAGFFPEKGKGCRPKQNSDVFPKDAKDLDCKKYCSDLGFCKLINNNVSCYCEKISYGNPYSDCKPNTPPPPPAAANDVIFSKLTAVSG